MQSSRKWHLFFRVKIFFVSVWLEIKNTNTPQSRAKQSEMKLMRNVLRIRDGCDFREEFPLSLSFAFSVLLCGPTLVV